MIRRLALGGLVFATLHVIFGAIVRITGSGFGCGEHWPTCHGYWFPPLERMDLIIEVSHRYLAAILSAVILGLVAVAWRRRSVRGVAGPGGVLRPALLATLLVVAAALFGAVIVRLELANRMVVVVHLTLAMTLLATLAIAAARAGGFGGSVTLAGGASRRTARGAVAAAGIAFLVLVMGALTANLPGAASACTGFPHCRGGTDSAIRYVQLTHRLLAFALFFHMLGLLIGVQKRREASPLRKAAAASFALLLVQILVAAAMVETGLPLVLRSVHQALGTLAWVAIVLFATLAARGVRSGRMEEGVPTFVATAAPAAEVRSGALG